ncbi:hypothetical protein JXR93_08790 [bacterium]|nr:hypothetical protein [bacterium]
MRFFYIIILILLVSCSTTKGRTGFFLDGIYKNFELKYVIGEFPKEWRSIDVESVNLAFYNKSNHSVIYVNGKCKKSSDAPLEVLRMHLLIGFKDKKIELSEKINIEGREGLHSIVTAKMDGVSRKIEGYIFKKDGCLYDLILISPEISFKDNSSFFNERVKEFKILKGSNINIVIE